MFMGKVLASAPLHFCKRKILDAIFITKLKLDLYDQIEHHALSLLGLLELIKLYLLSRYVLFI